MTGPIARCQSCSSADLDLVVSLGNLAPCNDFRRIGEPPREQITYPADLLQCAKCELVQLGFVAPQDVVFPSSYPYTSSTTRALRENFTHLAADVRRFEILKPNDLVVDIGGNDGNLLSNLSDYRRLNVTPEDMGKRGEERGIPHLQRYFDQGAADLIVSTLGKARLVTATNVFAHVPDPHGFVAGVLSLLDENGVFVSEHTYWGDTVAGLQWDTAYHEHQRYYSAASLTTLLAAHGLSVRIAHRIPTHGGSIRVYAARPGHAQWLHDRGERMVDEGCSLEQVRGFAARVADSRRKLWSLLGSIDGRVVGIGAPSRAGTLLGYTGIDEHVMPYVCETAGSHKVGHYFPGTRIEVVDEARLYEEQPECAMLLSWHIADELKAALRAKGFTGKFIVPLPEVRVE